MQRDKKTCSQITTRFDLSKLSVAKKNIDRTVRATSGSVCRQNLDGRTALEREKSATHKEFVGAIYKKY